MKIMILGASGMLGHAMARVLAARKAPDDLILISRSLDIRSCFPELKGVHSKIGVDLENTDSLLEIFTQFQFNVVINCIGLVKQRRNAENPLYALPINTLLPHRLAHLCALSATRLIHISTDCVFSGNKGNYNETDLSDALDVYGKSKFLGEITAPHAITLRTSIIGHELRGGSQGLVGWFLSQSGSVRGFSRAIFSGLPTVELATIICEHILPRAELSGVYHLAAAPISKLEFLQLVAHEYDIPIEIVADDDLVIDRSLDASRFTAATGYIAPDWPTLIRRMHRFG